MVTFRIAGFRTLVQAAVVSAIYCGLWETTAHYSVVSAHNFAMTRLPLGPYEDATYLFNRKPDPGSEATLEPGSYYLRTRALAPFVVELTYALNCGTLCGEGKTIYFLWLPGLLVPFHSSNGYIE